MKMNQFMLSDEDAEFLPIIPLNETDEQDKNLVVPDILPLLPLRNTVLFPGVVLPITVGRDKSIKAVTEAYKKDKLIGVLSQKDSNVEDPSPEDMCLIGTVAKIVKLIKMPDGGTTIIIQGKKRFRVKEVIQSDPYYMATIVVLGDDELQADEQFDAHAGSIKDLASQIIQISPNMPAEASIILKNIESPSFLVNFVSNNLNTDVNDKQSLLEIDDLKLRAEKLIELLQKELQFAELKNKVTTKTKTELDKQQREYFLQQQLKSIKDELGGDANDRELQEMKKKAEAKKWPLAAKDLFQKEIEKLERMHPGTPDYS